MAVSKHAPLLKSRGFVKFTKKDTRSFAWILVQSLLKGIPNVPLYFFAQVNEHEKVQATFARDELGEWWHSNERVDLRRTGFTEVEELWRKHSLRSN